MTIKFDSEYINNKIQYAKSAYETLNIITSGLIQCARTSLRKILNKRGQSNLANKRQRSSALADIFYHIRQVAARVSKLVGLSYKEIVSNLLPIEHNART